MKKIILILALMLPTAIMAQRTPALKTGRWHAEFQVKNGAIPFTFKVKTTPKKHTLLVLMNGKERVQTGAVRRVGDSIFIPIEDYDTQLGGVLKGDTLKGVFKRLFSAQTPGIPFIAYPSDRPRFTNTQSTSSKLKGRWDVTFISGQKRNKRVGIFEQQGNTLTGSILTNSGDLRFLEGTGDAKSFQLSAFAGLSPYLVKGKFTSKKTFEGYFITSRGKQQIQGVRNPKAMLDDPYKLTKLRKGYHSLGFSLPNLKGEKVTLSDKKYRGKVVVVSILGSWCPNCLDEANFLAPWYKANKKRGVEVLGIAFERKSAPAYVQRVLSNLIKKRGITYTMLSGGKIGDVKKVLPEIEGSGSFPTTLFIDKKGVVRKIHTGFSGPATGLFYDEFKKEFNKLIDQLLSEE